jgi:hypothetical protein
MAITFAKLLEANYNNIISEDVEFQLIKYIEATPSLERCDISFIKKITKVATNIIGSGKTSLDGLLERIYQYHEEGVELIHKSGEYHKQQSLITASHLASHAGDVAERIYKKTEDNAWAEKWFESQVSASVMLDSLKDLAEKEIEHSSICKSKAGGAARTMYFQNKGKPTATKWAAAWLQYKLDAAESRINNQSIDAARDYYSAGVAAHVVADTIGDLEKEEIAYHAFSEAMERSYGIDLVLYADSLQRAVSSASRMHHHTRKLVWLNTAYELSRKMLDFASDNDLDNLESHLETVGDLAYKMFRQTGDPKYGDTTYLAYLNLAWRLEGKNIWLEAFKYSQAGSIASVIAQFTTTKRGRKKWLRRAQKNLNRFVEILEPHMGELPADMRHTYASAKRKIHGLQNALRNGGSFSEKK